jgi:hypothetical protein
MSRPGSNGSEVWLDLWLVAQYVALEGLDQQNTLEKLGPRPQVPNMV